MPSRSRCRFAQTVPAAALLTVGALAGCADPESSPPGADRPSDVTGDEVAAHDGRVCPRKLPQAKDPGYGFGTEEPAASAPSLPAPEAAWVCEYSPSDAGPGPNGDGTTLAWVLVGDATPVDSTRFPALEDGLTKLGPAEDDQVCTSELGPRWMLVYSHGRDLTGVVVDDFGCQDIRLTDEPFETPPGDATQAGTVRGVLAGPAGLLTDLKAVVAERD